MYEVRNNGRYARKYKNQSFTHKRDMFWWTEQKNLTSWYQIWRKNLNLKITFPISLLPNSFGSKLYKDIILIANVFRRKIYIFWQRIFMRMSCILKIVFKSVLNHAQNAGGFAERGNLSWHICKLYFSRTYTKRLLYQFCIKENINTRLFIFSEMIIGANMEF